MDIPSYFPTSRYETTGELLVDHDNQKIISLPAVVHRNSYDHSLIKHVDVRSVKDQIINKAENALIGGTNQNTDSSGVHPGILYGGPAGVLAPIGVYFYKLFKRRSKKKKNKKKGKKNDSENEGSEEDENNETTIADDITTAVTTQISNASSSVVSHIKGKISQAGTSLVDDLKTQAIAQEEEILESIKSTILEQEEEMVVDIKEKFATTRGNLIKDIKSKFSILEKSRTTKNVKDQTFQEKRKNEESLCKLSDSENEIVNTVKRRISNADDALIQEIEKSIESTNESIIKKIENEIPRAEGKTLNTMKQRLRERGRSLFNEIKSMLTCTENKIIDDVKSHIEDVTSEEEVQRTETKHKEIDEIKVEIIDPNAKDNQSENRKIKKEADMCCESILNDDKVEIVQPKKNKDDEKKVEIDRIQMKPPEECDKMKEDEGQDMITVTKKTEEDIVNKTDNQKTIDIEDEIPKKTSMNRDVLTSNDASSRFSKIKQKMPYHFLKRCPKMAENLLESGSQNEESTNSDIGTNDKIQIASMRRTSPIPIPCIHQTKLNHPTAERKGSDDLQSSTSSGNDKEKDENSSLLGRIKNSVSHLPFNLGFSGIPEKVKAFMEPRKDDAEAELEGIEVELVKEVSAESTNPLNHVTFEETKICVEEDENSKNVTTRRWIVLECYDGDWPSHLPRNENLSEKNETQQSNVPTSSTNRWLHLEDIDTTWPNHLPKNHHGNCTSGITKDLHEKHHRRHRHENIDKEEDSEEDDENWKERLPKNLLKPMNTDDERKASNVSSTSEFSTTSSVGTTSSGTLESSIGSKLPNFDEKLKKRQNRSARLKSLDSGIHHYYGEYISIEFRDEKTVNENVETTRDREDNIRASEGSGSSENSQEDDSTVINRSDGDATECAAPEELQGRVIEEGGGCYEGFVVSLGNRRIEKISSGHQDERNA